MDINISINFSDLSQLIEYILDGCETVEEAKNKLKIFSSFQLENEKDDKYDLKNSQKEKTRIRVKRYRERQKNAKVGGNNTCVYCGAKAEEIDHLVPVSKGGLNSAENLVPVCKKMQ